MYKVTVLMPVYNGEQYLKDAIESILSQTYKNFEFIIINDGSTDNSVNIIESFNNSKIKFINNERNIGLIATLNKGLELAQGEYVVRMDQDDISLHDRIQKQVSFMDKNPSIGVCGSYRRLIGEIEGQVIEYPLPSAELKVFLMFGSCFAHPAVIIRKSILDENNLRYPDEFPAAEDYGLWAKLIKYTEFATIPEALLLHRIHRHQMSQLQNCDQMKSTLNVQKFILEELGLYPSDNEMDLHNRLCNGTYIYNLDYLIKTESWLLKLLSIDQNKLDFSKNLLDEYIQKKWFKLCYKLGKKGISTWEIYNKSILSNKFRTSKIKILTLWLVNILNQIKNGK